MFFNHLKYLSLISGTINQNGFAPLNEFTFADDYEIHCQI